MLRHADKQFKKQRGARYAALPKPARRALREAEHRACDENDVAVDCVYAVPMEPDGAQPTADSDLRVPATC